ncbi:ScbA/BarX family gamma-butyrolactone biosynthesis protein [Streptomyces sp. NPDC059999]|uniref:ScbA/BarX family gamma-butyrolactone biosynthesis protein n=1 Tax=unclassified Streptomyces TaxID=2593676 RepID=UPI00226E3272|nr:ScbA/BarX family gamma-butyrolactone biosynthesis protein [Streptomyces sp. H27-G5]MCY0920588.1 ScbA/BarX family gamma-butyrolactone biosynthesis protein [Streptomyces sp. H27-G5]
MPSLASTTREPVRNSALVPQPRTAVPQPRTTTGHAGLTTTVPREYVHRAAVSEVLLTGWEPAADASPAHRSGPRPGIESVPDGPDAFVVRSQWPRGHSLFSQTGGYQDPMLLIESVRQIGALLSHAEFDVPFGHQFLMWDMSFATTKDLLVAGPAPAEVELRTVCHDVVRRGRVLSGMRYDVTALVDGVPLATAGAAFSCTSPAVHRRLRGDRPTSTDRVPGRPIDPALVGRTAPTHVVLTEDPTAERDHQWELRVDSTHPIFFDHPVDHVPGMVLLEAARQAAHASTGLPDALVISLDSTFARYAELDRPCRIVAHPGLVDAAGHILVQVCGFQDDQTVFAADLVLSPRNG